MRAGASIRSMFRPRAEHQAGAAIPAATRRRVTPCSIPGRPGVACRVWCGRRGRAGTGVPGCGWGAIPPPLPLPTVLPGRNPRRTAARRTKRPGRWNGSGRLRGSGGPDRHPPRSGARAGRAYHRSGSAAVRWVAVEPTVSSTRSVRVARRPAGRPAEPAYRGRCHAFGCTEYLLGGRIRDTIELNPYGALTSSDRR